MLLMIDNYDSFTYTLVRYFRELGQTVRVVRHDALSVHDLVKWRPDYVVISPGPGLPGQAGCLLDFIRACYQRVPILGVCLPLLGRKLGSNTSIKSFDKYCSHKLILNPKKSKGFSNHKRYIFSL